jgi:hypothetical protein
MNTTGPATCPRSGDPRPHERHGQPGPGDPGDVPGFPEDSGQEEVDVLCLAGQRAPAAGAWLLAAAVDGQPGGEFTAQVLSQAAPAVFGGDVVVRLVPDDPPAGQPPPAARVQVCAVLGGRLIPVAAWPGQDLDGWPERIRPTVAFTMGVLTELEEHDADLGGHQRVDLTRAAGQVTAGIPLHLTFPAARPRLGLPDRSAGLTRIPPCRLRHRQLRPARVPGRPQHGAAGSPAYGRPITASTHAA